MHPPNPLALQPGTGIESFGDIDRTHLNPLKEMEHDICMFRFCGDCDVTEMHYNDVIMGAIASQITSLTIVYSIVYSDADQRKHQSSASLAFVRGIHRRPGASNTENVSIWWRHHGNVGKWITYIPESWQYDHLQIKPNIIGCADFKAFHLKRRLSQTELIFCVMK